MRPYARSLLLAVLVLAAGCSPKPEPQVNDCPAPRPAFALLVRTADRAPLPRATRIVVAYGGSAQESFDLKAPPSSPQVVFCALVPPGSDPDGGAVDAGRGDDDGGEQGAVEQVACRLWTDGAANVMVEAEGLATEKRTLEAKTDGCGIVTTDVTIELSPEPPKDGGKLPLRGG